MSIASIDTNLINNSHYIPFTIYPLTDSSETRCPPAHRLAEIKWRLTEEAKAKGADKRSPVCIAIPFLRLLVEPTCLQEAVQERIEAAQDSMIATFINNQIKENTRWNMIGKLVPSEIATPDGLSTLLNEERARSRLSKESIATYFDSFLVEPLLANLVSRNPDMEDSALTKAAARYKEALTALASPRAMIPPKSAIALNKVIDLGCDGKVKRALKEKLNSFINPPKEEELADLL